MDTRSVRHLRLRCESAEQAVQATRVADRIGEALRCATLPQAPGRVLLVRRLALGRLPAAGHAVALTLQLQAAVQRAGWTWVRGDTAAAAAAPAVWFAHLAHVVATAWAWRAAGRPLDAWYWPSALPGVALAAPLPALRQSLRALIERQVGDGAATRWWPQPPGASAPPAAPLRGGDHRAGLAKVPAEMPATVPAPMTRTAATSQGAAREVPPTATATAADLVGVAGAALHPRAVVRTQPADGAQAAPAGAQTPWVPASAVPPAVDAMPPGPGVGGRPAPRRRSARAVGAPALSPAPGRAAPPAPATPTQALPAEAALALPAALAGLVEPGASAWATPAATGVGGLLLLLSALQRMPWLGYPRDAADFAALSRTAIARLHPAPADPVHALIDDLAGGVSLAPRQALARDIWRVLRVWLRHEVGIGPAHLLVRRAALRWDTTHIDLHFALNDADLRLRRAGLDLSPGWLPCLGRVVTVHFGAWEAAR